jgi:hypothetical protein
MCLDLLRPTEPCSTVLLGFVLFLIVPDIETVRLTETDYIGVFLSSHLIELVTVLLSSRLTDWDCVLTTDFATSLQWI